METGKTKTITNKIFLKELELRNIRDKTDGLDFERNKIKSYKNRHLNKIHEELFSYHISDILKLMDVRPNNKKLISERVNKISIYRRDTFKNFSLFYIKYHYGDENLIFKTKVSNETVFNILSIKRNGKSYIQFDLFKEFRSYNWARIEAIGSLENYLKLFIEEDFLIPGMLLIAYFFLIEYIKYDPVQSNLTHIFDKDNIVMFKKLFDRGIEKFLRE